MKTPPSPKTIAPPPIAIIGMGCFFAKANDLKSYWRLFSQGTDGVTDPPESRRSLNDYFDADPKKPDHIYCNRGGYLSPITFDPTAFGIPPNSLEATDTSQLLGLMAAQMALSDAGYGNGKPFDRERTSVIIGVTGTQELVIPLSSRLGHPKWRDALRASGVSAEKSEEVIQRIADTYVPWQENSFPGLLGNVVAGRICNRLNLGGTNCVVDAACASSMSALHLALLELVSGRSEMVLTGGVDTLNDIFMHMCFSKTGILSPTGDIRPFSQNADGTVLGEGVGLMVLKRLSDAEKDGDRIYAVIKGIGTSSDGKSQSIYAPRLEGQARALDTAYAAANVDPETVELVEAHGTGTRVGDQVEFQALKSIFGRMNPNGNRCALGSVKSMVGHTKAAAGAAGLIKAALAVYHKVLPPTLKVDPPDPKLNVKESPFYLSTEKRPWLSAKPHPRRAGISSFGFGGSNFHMVIEEHSPRKAEAAWDGSIEIIALSGDSNRHLADSIAAMKTTIKGGSNEILASVAARSRKDFNCNDTCRLLIIADTVSGIPPDALLKKAMDALAAHKDQERWQKDNIYYSRKRDDSPIAFMFPGQGSQYRHMGRDLVCTFPEAMTAIEAANEAYDGSEQLSDIIFPKPLFAADEQQHQDAALRQTDVAQPAIGALSVAMLRVLDRFGVKPGAVFGHSYGELCALHAAGRIDVRTLMKLSVSRGRFMADAGKNSAGDPGTMLAVNAPIDELASLAASLDGQVVLANRNSQDQGVLSGATAHIRSAEAQCRKKGFRCIPLPVAAAFHSPLVKSAQAPFAAEVATVRFNESSIPVYSNLTARPYPDTPETVGKWLSDQLVNSVRFIEEVENLHADGFRTFVEVGPKSVLSGLISNILKGKAHAVMAMDESAGRRSGILDLARCLCRLSAMGYPVALDKWENTVTMDSPPKMRIPISGANYENPQKKEASRRPFRETSITATHQPETKTQMNKGRRNGEISRAPIGAQPISAATATYPDAAAGEAVSPVSSQNRTTANNAPDIEPSREKPMKTTTTPHSPNPNKVKQIQETLRIVQQGLASMQALQEQTAQAHQKFLETQAQAGRTLQEMMNSTQRLAEATLGLAPGGPVSLPPVEAQPHLQFPKEYAAAKTAMNQSRPTAIQTPPHPNAAPAAPVSATAATETQSPTEPEMPSPASSIAPSPSHGDIQATLLEIVSELTGYPAEMLDTGMDIEADLGIDSIKRVEILSTLEERVPGLPKVTPEMMGTLKTLAQIIEYLGSGGDIAEGNTQQLAGPPSPASSIAPSPSHGDIQATLLEIVSELTGYPAEMLDTGMDIEADLGIDSIKRVEILSTLEERVPGLPKVTPEMMGTLKTLAQIIEYLGSGGDIAEGNTQQLAGPPSPASSIAPSPSHGDIQATLLEIVSELTGYPAEMLDTGMDIEADLGIDSIKRVEILSTLEERMPGLPKVTPEMMGTLKTLAQIIEFLSGGNAPMNPVADVEDTTTPQIDASVLNPAPDDPAPNTAPFTVERQRVKPVATALSTRRKLTLPQGRHLCIIGDHHNDFSRMLAENLKASGLPAVFISDNADANVKEVKDAAGLILAKHMEPKNAFQAARRFAPILQKAAAESDAVFVVISHLDGAFGFTGKGLDDPLQGALAGLAKTAALEWKGVICRALDLDPAWTDPKAAAGAVAAEICHIDPHGPVEIGLQNRSRVTLVLETAAYPDGPLDLKPNDVVVVSGGGRGVTAETVKTLARRCGATFILLGRSPRPTPDPIWLQGITDPAGMKQAILRNADDSNRLSPKQLDKAFHGYQAGRELAATLEAVRQAGARAEYIKADIRDQKKVVDLLKRVRSEYGPITAVIHGAGVLEDRWIVDKTDAQFDKVFSTKVAGLNSLLHATEADDLKYLVLFSSISARMGNKGQADYAMANEVLNKTAWQQAALRPRCRVIAINWGPWDGGMVTASLKREFQKHHIPLIPLQEGADMMIREMGAEAGKTVVEVVIGGRLPHENRPAELPLQMKTDAQKKPPADLSCFHEREIDLRHYPVLEDHVIGGQPVIPFALMTEWLGQSAMHGNPGLRFIGIDDIRLLNGIKLDQASKGIRLMTGTARKHENAYEVWVEIRNSRNGGKDKIHSRAKVMLSDTIPAPPRFTGKINKNGRKAVKNVKEWYDKLLFHGTRLQGIKVIHSLSKSSLVAALEAAPLPEAWMSNPLRSRWISDPLILDSAFQMAIIWCHEQMGQLCLPSYVASYRQFREHYPPEGVTAVLHVGKATKHRFTGDFTFLDDNGAVVAQLTGYEAVMDSSLYDAFKPGSSKAA